MWQLIFSLTPKGIFLAVFNKLGQNGRSKTIRDFYHSNPKQRDCQIYVQTSKSCFQSDAQMALIKTPTLKANFVYSSVGKSQSKQRNLLLERGITTLPNGPAFAGTNVF